MRINKALEKLSTKALWELNGEVATLFNDLGTGDKKRNFWLAVAKAIQQEIDNRLGKDFEE